MLATLVDADASPADVAAGGGPVELVGMSVPDALGGFDKQPSGFGEHHIALDAVGLLLLPDLRSSGGGSRFRVTSKGRLRRL